MSGFFLTTRGITSHPLFKRKPDRLAVWMWLLDNAAFKDTTQDAKGKIVPVPRGSVCASLRHIADETGVGHQVVRTALKRFETEHMVNTKVTHGKSVISLCNYDKHQRSDGGGNTAPNTTLTQDQHKPNTQKKQGNKESKEDTNVSSGQGDLSQHFQDFWDAYPHRGGKKKRAAAEMAFSKAIKAGATLQDIATGVEDMRKDPDVQRGYARDPTTWLNQKGWTDEFSEAQPQFKTITGGHNGQSTNKSEQRVSSFVSGAAGSS